MTKTKVNDFVEIDYIGKIKETNEVFDLTDLEQARQKNMYNPKATYGPRTIQIGKKQIIKGIDEFLADKETGKTYTLEIKPEDAFGKKDAKWIKIITKDFLIEQGINPTLGLQISTGGRLGTIRSVSGGRVTVDFNHPLAGKNLVYEITINKVVENKISTESKDQTKR